MYLGLDIGTSGVKAVLVDDENRLTAEASRPLSVSRLCPLWSEQSPGDWWQAANAAVMDLPAYLRSSVQAIGLTGQMHGAVVLDRAGLPLRPAILWNDGRSATECAELVEACPDIAKIAGSSPMPGFTAPKLLWLRRHEPAIANAVDKVVLPKDYIRLLMTGDYATDASDASGTLWLDIEKRSWSEKLLEICGLRDSKMPKVYEGTQFSGRLRKEVATEWGMGRAQVVAGGSDNAAAAVGCGAIANGQAFLSLGTSGVLFVATDRFRPALGGGVHSFCHAIAGRWHQMAVVLSATSALNWIATAIGATNIDVALAEAESGGEPFSSNELFLPYLSGDRTPHNDPGASGVFFGLTLNTDRGALVRAVLEGVAFALTDGLSVLNEAGAAPSSLTVVGGGARSLYWASILANALNRPLIYPRSAHFGPAFGAARLAMIGLSGELPEAIAKALPIEQLISPRPDLTVRAYEKYEAYRKLYPALCEQFRLVS